MKVINKTCIIDDDEIYIFGTKRLIENNKFSKDITVYKNGLEALNHLQKEIIDLPNVILLDLNMPIMDGWQFLDAFSKLNISKEVAIFIVSSSVNQSDLIKAKSYSIVKDYLVKPLKVSSFEKILTHF